MPQHLWRTMPPVRVCEACSAVQVSLESRWTPRIYHICPGDRDDHGGRRTPLTRSDGPRVLECA
jgi:hypothetical protein